MKIKKQIGVIVTVEDKKYSEEERIKMLLEYFCLLGDWRAKEIFNKELKTKLDHEDLALIVKLKHILAKFY